ncbi:MAG: hypothetical protein ACI33P_01185 [Lysinibacillus sp.]
MTMKKWIYLILALAITGYIILLYGSFNGNPISKAIAKKHATDYLEEYYPERNFSIKDSSYNFKDQSYYFHYIVNEKNDQVYNYSIEIGKGWRPDHVIYHSLRYDSEDIEMSSAFTEAGTAHIRKLLTEAGLQAEAYYYVQVPLGYVDSTTEWTPEIELPVAADIHVYTDREFKSKKAFVQYAADVTKEMRHVRYNELHIESTISKMVDGAEVSSVAYSITLGYDEDPAIKNVRE